jgi:hypothetical protein
MIVKTKYIKLNAQYGTSQFSILEPRASRDKNGQSEYHQELVSFVDLLLAVQRERGGGGDSQLELTPQSSSKVPDKNTDNILIHIDKYRQYSDPHSFCSPGIKVFRMTG